MKIDRTEALERVTMTYEEIYASSHRGILADPFQSCLLETKEFLKLFEHLYRLKVSRRNLQLYSSPGYQFIPLPIHKGGYKSYYLNPEHTVGLAVALHLQRRHRFPAKAIQKVMRALPEEQFRFILEDVLTGEEVLQSAVLVKQGYGIRDILYQKVSRVLESVEKPYRVASERFGKHEDEKVEKFVDQAIVREAKRLEGWVKGGGRRRIGMAQVGGTEQEHREFVSWLHAIQDKAGKA